MLSNCLLVISMKLYTQTKKNSMKNINGNVYAYVNDIFAVEIERKAHSAGTFLYKIYIFNT